MKRMPLSVSIPHTKIVFWVKKVTNTDISINHDLHTVKISIDFRIAFLSL